MSFFIGFQESFGIVEVFLWFPGIVSGGKSFPHPFHLIRKVWPLPCFLWEIMASTLYSCSPLIRSGGGIA